MFVVISPNYILPSLHRYVLLNILVYTLYLLSSRRRLRMGKHTGNGDPNQSFWPAGYESNAQCVNEHLRSSSRFLCNLDDAANCKVSCASEDDGPERHSSKLESVRNSRAHHMVLLDDVIRSRHRREQNVRRYREANLQGA